MADFTLTRSEVAVVLNDLKVANDAICDVFEALSRRPELRAKLFEANTQIVATRNLLIEYERREARAEREI